MALLKGPCHSILLGGNLEKSNVISIKLPFYQELCSNLWQISLNEISINFIKPSNVLTGISTNFVTDTKYNNDGQVICYCPCLWQCVFKSGSINDNKNFKFEQSWFYVSNAQEEIQLQFHKLKGGKVLNDLLALECDVYVTVLLQRVK